MRCPARGPQFAKSLELIDLQFETGDWNVGPDVGGPDLLDQRHLAKSHAVRQACKPHAAGSFTLTMPLSTKKMDVAGAPEVTILSPE